MTKDKQEEKPNCEEHAASNAAKNADESAVSKVIPEQGDQLIPEPSIEQRLNMQTARIPWSELAKFFAAGKAIYVDSSLDLIDVAAAVHRDDKEKIQALMQASTLGAVSDEQARLWSETDASLWAVVVSPWVLVQAPRQ